MFKKHPFPLTLRLLHRVFLLPLCLIVARTQLKLCASMMLNCHTLRAMR